MTGRKWDDAADEQLRQLWYTMPVPALAAAIKRTERATLVRAYHLGLRITKNFRRRRAPGDAASGVIVRRRPELGPLQAFRALPPPVSLTAALMGDPLPGRSALDRRAT